MPSFETIQGLYQETGFAIFPLVPDRKIPLKGSHGFRDARIVELRDSWPQGANVGIATGMRSGGLVVIDCDGEEGHENLRDLLMMNRVEINTLAVRTPHGYHYYFRSFIPFASNASVLMPHVDVRAEGGYVVGPGSVAKGKDYYITRRQWSVQTLPDALAKMLKITEPNLGEPSEPIPSGDALEVNLTIGIEMYRDADGKLRARVK